MSLRGRWPAILATVLGAPLLLGDASHRTDAAAPRALAAMPPLVLWAWQRPEALDFIDPARVGVAFFALDLRLAGGSVFTRSGRPPLTVPAGTKLIAVAHVEVDRRAAVALSDRQRDMVVAALVEMSRRPGLSGIQIDFEARPSEQAFYAALLHELRREIGAALPLSITALASWCMHESWTRALPVDEIVPMLFRMGPDGGAIAARQADGRGFVQPNCRRSYGVATDERLIGPRGGQRVYVFNPRSWTEVAYATVLREMRR